MLKKSLIFRRNIIGIKKVEITIQETNRKKDIIKEGYSKENTSIRQLSRVFGIGKKVIKNVIKRDK